MKFNKLTPNLMVEDVAQTLDYYLEVLGFEFVMSVPQGSQQVKMTFETSETLDYGMVKHGTVELMFQARHSLAEELPLFDEMNVGGSFTCYVELEGLDEYFGKIKDKVDVVSGPANKFYGMREFCIRDCNGYFLAFGERT